MIPLNTSVVSGVAISDINGEAKILMTKRIRGRFWCHVAGKIKANEEAWKAIIREFKEETGITAKKLYSVEYLEQFYQASNERIMIIPVFVVKCSENQSIALNEEHSEFKWCSLKEAIELASFPTQKNLYNHIWEYFIKQKPSKLMAIKIC